jgi:hypothetical protein
MKEYRTGITERTDMGMFVVSTPVPTSVPPLKNAIEVATTNLIAEGENQS